MLIDTYQSGNPSVNPHCWQSDRLVACVPGNENGLGGGRDVAQQIVLAATTVSTDSTLKPVDGFPHILMKKLVSTSDTVGQKYVWPAVTSIQLKNENYALISSFFTLDSGARILSLIKIASTVPSTSRFALNSVTSGVMRIVYRKNSADAPTFLNGPTLSLGTPYHIAAYVDNVVGVLKLYINGIFYASSNIATGLFENSDSSQPACLGADYAGLEYYDGHFADLRVYVGRPFTDAEVLDLCFKWRDLYRFDISRPVFGKFFGYSLALNDLSFSPSFDNLSLNHDYSLLSNDSSIAPNIDNLSLNHDYSLLSNDSSIAPNIDSLALNHDYSLLSDDLSFSSSFDGLSISHFYSLDSNDLSFSSALDNLFFDISGFIVSCDDLIFSSSFDAQVFVSFYSVDSVDSIFESVILTAHFAVEGHVVTYGQGIWVLSEDNKINVPSESNKIYLQ